MPASAPRLCTQDLGQLPTRASVDRHLARCPFVPGVRGSAGLAENAVDRGQTRRACSCCLGLIQQLSSTAGDRYSLADATFAVDSLHEDCNAQAALSAKSYLSMTAFSCSGLVRQLSSSAVQFTVAQAQYGATAAGIC